MQISHRVKWWHFGTFTIIVLYLIKKYLCPCKKSNCKFTNKTTDLKVMMLNLQLITNKSKSICLQMVHGTIKIKNIKRSQDLKEKVYWQQFHKYSKENFKISKLKMFKICSHWQKYPSTKSSNRSPEMNVTFKICFILTFFAKLKKKFTMCDFSPLLGTINQYSVFISTIRHIHKYIIQLLWTWQSSQSVVYYPTNINGAKSFLYF